MTATATPDIEDNWFSLIEEIKAGTVIPVIGPDLLEIQVSDASSAVHSARLDVLIAEDLSQRYGLPLAAQPADQPRQDPPLGRQRSGQTH